VHDGNSHRRVAPEDGRRDPGTQFRFVVSLIDLRGDPAGDGSEYQEKHDGAFHEIPPAKDV